MFCFVPGPSERSPSVGIELEQQESTVVLSPATLFFDASIPSPHASPEVDDTAEEARMEPPSTPRRRTARTDQQRYNREGVALQMLQMQTDIRNFLYDIRNSFEKLNNNLENFVALWQARHDTEQP